MSLWKYFIFLTFSVFLHPNEVGTVEVYGSRLKRDLNSPFNIPQPTVEFPLVLFKDDHFNNGTEGVIHRSRANEYRVWAGTSSTAVQYFIYRSLIVQAGWQLVFQACCVAGNKWTKTVSNVTNITSLHYFMFDNNDIGDGIFYTQWLHWEQEFAVKAVRPLGSDDHHNLTCSQPCYFGSCGEDGNCQCKSGYSGVNCEQRPTNQSVYPNHIYPLLLFPLKDFQGIPMKVLSNTYHMFAENTENKRKYHYLSARVLFTRPILLSRNLADDQKAEIQLGSDINNLESFLNANQDISQPLWMTYATTIDSKFYIKVKSDEGCRSCDNTGGCCYTGKCICLPGFNGTDCSNKI